MVLDVDIEKCVGCRTCEVTCSLKNTGTSNPTRSRIKVIRYERQGEFHNYIPMVCQQCTTPLCMEVCPVNAISRDPETGAMVVDTDDCVGCKVCGMVCPVGGISVDPISDVAYKCDLCSGDPECVKICDPEAITYVPKSRADLRRRRERSKKLSELLALMESLR
ncbi:MAG: 4Fe-4S dicluster domain-containing protein [Candidatus Bathyarchaeota archaeon]|jgi:Fe-S-cluster-containing hydrogenase component 2